MLKIPWKHFILCTVACSVVSACLKIKSRVKTEIPVTLAKPAGSYNPLPTQIDLEFTEDIEMDSITEGIFSLRHTCGVANVAISQVTVTDKLARLTISNGTSCDNGESFTVRMKNSLVEFSDSAKKGSGTQSFMFTKDATAPTVAAAINTLSSLTTSDEFSFASTPSHVTYTFSSDINLDSVTASDFEIESTGGTDCSTMPTVGTLVKDATAKTVRVPLTGATCSDGESFQITLGEDAVADSTRNGATGAAVPNTGPSADLTFQITRWSTSAAVESVGDGDTSASGDYSTDDEIDIVVKFDADVDVTGTPRLRLNITGGATRYATYVSGTGTDSLLFRYTVATGDVAADLDYFSTTALQLNGGTIARANSGGGITASLTLPSPGATNSLSDLRDIAIDTSNPTITTSSPAGPANTWGTAARDVTFTFSEALEDTTVESSDLTITAGTCSGAPTVLSATLGGAGENVITFELSDNTCGDGETYSISLDPESVEDQGGLEGSGSPRTINVTTDASGPTLAVGSPSKTRVNSDDSLTYTVTFSGATAVTLSDGDITIDGASAGCVAAVSGSGLTTRTITVSDCSGDGDVQISIKEETATDASGNLAPAVDEGDITDFTADNTELTDPTHNLPTVGSNDLYNEDTLSDFTLTFTGDVLGTQSAIAAALSLNCDNGGGPNTVAFSAIRTSDEVVTVAPTESSGDFVYNAACSIAGTEVPDAAGNTHDFSALNFKVTKTPDATSGPSGSYSISSATDLGNVVFNVSMDASTVNSTNVTLVCDGQDITITDLSASVSDTTFTVDFDESDSEWVSMVGGESCVLQWTTDVTNSLGTPLPSIETFNFTTSP